MNIWISDPPPPIIDFPPSLLGTSFFRSRGCTYIHVHTYIIQLTPRRGFLETNYIKYYAYLYLLSLYKLSLQQLWYYFPNYVYPNPPTLPIFPAGGNRSTRRKPTTFGRALTDSFHTSPPGLIENRTHALRRERRLLWRPRHRRPSFVRVT
jgi:hypothetical protein